MKRISLFLLVIGLVSVQTFAAHNNVRYKYNFNHDWKVIVKDISDVKDLKAYVMNSKDVTLPYAWNEDEAFKKDITGLSAGIAWYVKNFKLPAAQRDMKVFIEFEGVRQAAEVYVNGHYLGMHENGVSAFGFDITDFVRFGIEENTITVKTDNSWDYKEKSSNTGFQWNDKNFNANYGGIPKNVILHVTGKVYQTLPLYTNLKTTGQYIFVTNIDIINKTATITVESEVKNELNKEINLSFEAEIEDQDGKLIKTIRTGEIIFFPGETKIIKASDTLEDMNFWSWGYGYLYKVNSILKQNKTVIDKVSTFTGFRKTEFANGMIKLNDRVIMIKGYAQRTSNEWPALGMSVPPWISDYSNKLMVKSNANLVRWMHITPWKQDIESCDRVGLMQAMPAGDSEKDVVGRQWEHRIEAMRDAIIYNRNNPSIVFYESGNNDISEEHMQEMKLLRDLYDPFGGRAIGSRNMLDSKVAEYGGEMLYVNKSSEMPVWAMEYMRDEALRKYWDEYSFPFHKDGEGPLHKGQDASAYNRNQDSYACEAVKRWYDYYRERPGTGKYVSSGGVNIVFSETNTHHRGSENYRRSGEVDALRIPKDAYFAHQVMWDGWVDIEKYNTHIVGHWNYDKETTKNIYVISSGENVELLVNGKSNGLGKREYGFLFTFDSIKWKPGEMEAISYDKEKKIVSSAKLKTTRDPQKIKLSLICSPDGMWADGSDIAIVQVEVVDINGERCPVAFNRIDFELIGNAEWRGGMAQGHNNYILSKSLPVECGINRVIIRSTRKAGEIQLNAVSGELEPATITFSSKPMEIKDGLSLIFPSETLPVNLEKGPTPSTPSFVPSRHTVEIIGAKAGANQENAFQSYDGSQKTRWVSDGKIENGWIEYKFEPYTEISEIALKLSGWRTRSYPIVVSSNDTILFRGLTTPNLGYFYIDLKNPYKTDHVKIRLYDATEFNDTYKLTEITGKLDKETANDRETNDAKSLNIVEVEIFRKD